MHICLFTSTFLPKIGGAERAIDRIARGFLQNNHEVTVLAQIPSDPQPLALPQNLPYKLVRFPRPLSRGIGAHFIRRHLSKLHALHRIDALQAHFIYYPGWVALDWCQKQGVVLSVVAHGDDIRSNGRYLQRKLTRKRSLQVLRQTPSLIVPSLSVKQRACELEPTLEKRVRVIPYGLDPEWAKEQRAIPELPEKYVAYLGRLSRGKGLELLLQAWNKSKLFEEGYTLVLAGGGNQEQELKAQAEGTSKILFTGRLSQPECVSLYRGAKFCVFPSQLPETFGLGLLEALSCGTPVLAHDTPAYREILEVCPAGQLVNCQEIGQFSQALQSMVQLSFEEEKLRAFLEKFSYQRMIEEHLSAIGSSVSSS